MPLAGAWDTQTLLGGQGSTAPSSKEEKVGERVNRSSKRGYQCGERWRAARRGARGFFFFTFEGIFTGNRFSGAFPRAFSSFLGRSR